MYVYVSMWKSDVLENENKIHYFMYLLNRLSRYNAQYYTKSNNCSEVKDNNKTMSPQIQVIIPYA